MRSATLASVDTSLDTSALATNSCARAWTRALRSSCSVAVCTLRDCGMRAAELLCDQAQRLDPCAEFHFEAAPVDGQEIRLLRRFRAGMRMSIATGALFAGLGKE